VIHNHIYAGGGIGTGSSLSGGVSHILVSDLTLDGSGVNMKTNDKLGGPVSDVEFDDVCIRGSRNPIHLVTHMNSTGHHEVDATEHNKTPQYKNIRFNNVLIQDGGRVMIDGLDAAHLLTVTLHNVVAEHPELIETVADEANIEVDGSNLTFSGEDLKISGTPSRGAANACDGRFVPFPVPVMTSRTVPSELQ
jgi:polygalacturonase